MTELRSILFDTSSMSAFGVLETAERTPVFQGDWVYGLNTQTWQTPLATGTGAVVDTDSSRMRIQSGTSAISYAYILPRRTAKYRAGQGMVAVFTPIFTSGVANNIQFWGMGSVASNVITDGYGFMCSGTSFGIGHYIRGAAVAFTAQGSWNGDKCDGSSGSSFTYDPTKGSPVMIKYPYLGYGDIFFFVQNPTSGRWVLCHTIRYANTVATTQLANPNLHFLGYTANSGNTNNVIMYCGSVGVFLSGVRSFIGSPKWAIDNNKSGITTETSLITLKNALTYNTITNRGLIRLNSISVSSSAASGVSVFRIKIGVALGGTPSYTPINGTTGDGGATITSGNSITSYDVAGTTITNGTYIWGITVDNPDSLVIDALPFEIFLAPGETLTVSGFSTVNAVLGVVLNWSEDI